MRQEAALLGTLFLNFAFWLYHGNALLLPLPLPLSALLITTLSALLTLLFLVGPALAVHRSGRSLFETIENSLGIIPTHAVRLCAIWFLVTWITSLITIPASWQLHSILHRDIDWRDTLIAATFLVAFLGYTALQRHPTNVTLAGRKLRQT